MASPSNTFVENMLPLFLTVGGLWCLAVLGFLLYMKMRRPKRTSKHKRKQLPPLPLQRKKPRRNKLKD